MCPKQGGMGSRDGFRPVMIHCLGLVFYMFPHHHLIISLSPGL